MRSREAGPGSIGVDSVAGSSRTTLTPTELIIVQFACQGFRSDEAGRRLPIVRRASGLKTKFTTGQNTDPDTSVSGKVINLRRSQIPSILGVDDITGAAIQLVNEGLIDPQIATDGVVMNGFTRLAPKEKLTIDELLSTGAANKELAEKLRTSPQDILSRCYAMFKKTNTHDRTQLVVAYMAFLREVADAQELNRDRVNL